MKKLILILSVLSIFLIPSCKKESQVCCKGDAVIDTILARRSIRSFKPECVADATLDKIIEAGINAPSAMNLQPWEVAIVNDSDSMEKLIAAIIELNPKLTKKAIVDTFRGAPTLAFVACDSENSYSQLDCGLLGENMLIAATSLGVGSIVLGSPVAFFNSKKGQKVASSLFGFSKNYKLLYVIGFGYANESPDAKPRNASKVKKIKL